MSSTAQISPQDVFLSTKIDSEDKIEKIDFSSILRSKFEFCTALVKNSYFGVYFKNMNVREWC